MTPVWIAIGVVGFILLYIVITYNVLVSIRNRVKESWSDIDTELKRRYDLIPNLVETVKGYAKHERETLEKITELRAKAVASTGSPASQAADENNLVRGLKTLFAVVENYPDLKASKNFLALQDELVNTEDRIQAARRFYNGNVRDLNNKIEMFPSSMIAGVWKFQKAEFFEVEEFSIRSVPSAKV